MTEDNFYEFDQNNPGGYFDTSMPRFLWVEASSAEEACEIAEKHGVYFDGVDKGIDCECCGDRWYRTRPRPKTREEVDELIEVRTGPDAFRWDDWPSQEAEFKIIEKKG